MSPIDGDISGGVSRREEIALDLFMGIAVGQPAPSGADGQFSDAAEMVRTAWLKRVARYAFAAADAFLAEAGKTTATPED